MNAWKTDAFLSIFKWGFHPTADPIPGFQDSRPGASWESPTPSSKGRPDRAEGPPARAGRLSQTHPQMPSTTNYSVNFTGAINIP